MAVAVMVGLAVAGASGMLTATLTFSGVRQLGTPDRGAHRLPVLGALVGALVGAAAAAAAHRSVGWPLLPAVVLWGSVLVAAGLCDARTQRIPTVLVRPGFVAVTVLLVIGHAVSGQWQGLVLAAVASLASAAVMLVCWRFLGAGQGDVRLALLGGLGLGGADGRGLLVGFVLFAVVVVGQVARQRAAGGGKPASVPLGPALAVGFITAMVLSALA